VAEVRQGNRSQAEIEALGPVRVLGNKATARASPENFTTGGLVKTDEYRTCVAYSYHLSRVLLNTSCYHEIGGYTRGWASK
jgi:hypothetical protein